MLKELHIKNIAVIQEVTISFDKGFHVLTGETGAGKSILIDSINMVLGGRTAKELIRTGADSAAVDAVFELSEEASERIGELGIEPEDDLLYISRKITPDGKSRCRINGCLVPLSMLKEISVFLLTIHGQNDNQSLLSPKMHMHFLDSYGNYGSIMEKYHEQYKKVQDLNSRLEELNVDDEERERRTELLTYQIQEISSAQLRLGEEEELESKREYLAHLEQISGNTAEAYAVLYGNEMQDAAFDQISSAVRKLENIHSYDEKIDSLFQTLSSVLADLEDITYELKSYLDGIDFQPNELDLLEERLSVINDMKRKYGGSVPAALEKLSNAKEELETLENNSAIRNKLFAELQKEQEFLEKLAFELSDKRKEAAIALQTGIMDELYDLDMQKMRFTVQVLPLTEADGTIRFTASGCDRVEFLLASNPGEDLKPLTKIASGGEMSRIMLAMKSILAGSDIVDTLIFDEIDTGVSGRAAQKIAEKICMLAKNHQVLCITHLAQIASMADVHFLIEKNTDDTCTRTTVTVLNKDSRKTELARIIGGVKITDLTLQAAQEMLDMADSLKERR